MTIVGSTDLISMSGIALCALTQFPFTTSTASKMKHLIVGPIIGDTGGLTASRQHSGARVKILWKPRRQSSLRRAKATSGRARLVNTADIWSRHEMKLGML